MVTQTCGWARAMVSAATRLAKARSVRTKCLITKCLIAKCLIMTEARFFLRRSPAPESRPVQHSMECGGMEAPKRGTRRCPAAGRGWKLTAILQPGGGAIGAWIVGAFE